MPASSSLTAPVIGHLADLGKGATGEPPGLLTVLAKMADPRRRRGAASSQRTARTGHENSFMMTAGALRGV
jgi:hypothetical protein